MHGIHKKRILAGMGYLLDADMSAYRMLGDSKGVDASPSKIGMASFRST